MFWLDIMAELKVKWKEDNYVERLELILKMKLGYIAAE